MLHSQSILKWVSQMSKQKTEQHSHADWWGSVQNLNKKNANALKSVVRAVGCCVSFFLFAFVVGFLVFSCFLLYIPEFAICKKNGNASWITAVYCTTMQY